MATHANEHPGRILLEEFLLPYDITVLSLSKKTEIPRSQIAQILKGTGRITHETASKLGDFLGTSDDYWLLLQQAYDKSFKDIN